MRLIAINRLTALVSSNIVGYVVNQKSCSLCSRGWCTLRRNGRENGTNCWSWPPVSHAHTLARTATPVEGNAHPHNLTHLHIMLLCHFWLSFHSHLATNTSSYANFETIYNNTSNATELKNHISLQHTSTHHNTHITFCKTWVCQR